MLLTLNISRLFFFFNRTLLTAYLELESVSHFKNKSSPFTCCILNILQESLFLAWHLSHLYLDVCVQWYIPVLKGIHCKHTHTVGEIDAKSKI